MADEGWLKRLRHSLGDRRVVPGDPPGRTCWVPAEDPAEAILPGQADDSSGWSCFITYGNAKGEDSLRTITFRKISGHYGQPELIGAYCHYRDAYRTFRVNRITGMACSVTGEELDPLQHCFELHQRGALKIEDKALTRLMTLLTFMARCDDHYHELERRELEGLLGRYARFFGGDDETLERSITECQRLAPSSTDLIRSLKAFARMARGPEICRFALNSCASIIDADGRHAEEEISWALEVSNALKRISDGGASYG